MSFMDKARQKAGELANQAQRGIDRGQAKLDENRRRRELDDLAKQLGWTVHRGRVEGSVDDDEVARLSALISTRESELADAVAEAAAAQPAGTQSPSTSAPPTGTTADAASAPPVYGPLDPEPASAPPVTEPLAPEPPAAPGPPSAAAGDDLPEPPAP